MKNIFLNEQFQIPGYKLLDYNSLPYQYEGNTIYEIYGSYKHLQTGFIKHFLVSFIVSKQGDGEALGYQVSNWTVTPIMSEEGHQAPAISNYQKPNLN
jgi:hypothetical protein